MKLLKTLVYIACVVAIGLAIFASILVGICAIEEVFFLWPERYLG